MAGLAAVAQPASASLVAHFNMEARSGQIVESVSGARFGVEGHFAPENVPGAVGQALRFDGYTSRVNAKLGDIFPAGSKQMTVSRPASTKPTAPASASMWASTANTPSAPMWVAGP